MSSPEIEDDSKRYFSSKEHGGQGDREKSFSPRRQGR
jgi:hypothetical protein